MESVVCRCVEGSLTFGTHCAICSVVETKETVDFLAELPFEISLHILSYLTPTELICAGQTSHKWRNVSNDTLLWRDKCQARGMEDVLGITTVANGEQCGQQGLTLSPWKMVYCRQAHVEYNWRERPLPPAWVIGTHDSFVITCLEFVDNRVLTASDDGTLKLWCSLTGECLRTLVGHGGGVWACQMSSCWIVSGSVDHTIRVWAPHTGECIHVLRGHSATVRCLHLHENRLASGSRDGTVRVWDVEKGISVKELRGHLASVRCVQFNGSVVVSGGYDCLVIVWYLDTGVIRELVGHTDRVYSLKFDGTRIVSGSLDRTIRVWNVNTAKCEKVLHGHRSVTADIALLHGRLISGNADTTTKVWDTKTWSCLHTLGLFSPHHPAWDNCHRRGITSVEIVLKKFIITTSDDGTVKLWDMYTGAFIRDLFVLASHGNGGIVWKAKVNNDRLVCSAGSRNGVETTKLLFLDFGTDITNSSLAVSTMDTDMQQQL